ATISESVTVKVEVSTPGVFASTASGMAAGVVMLYVGMGPAGPVTRRMFAEVKVPGWMSRLKVTSRPLLGPLSTRLSVAGVLAAGLKATLVPATRGPGMIRGRVSWL